MNRLIIRFAKFVFALLPFCIKADNKIVQDTDPFRRNQRLRRTINLGNAFEAPMGEIGEWLLNQNIFLLSRLLVLLL